MRQAGWAATLALALVFGPAQGSDTRLTVSATILSRIACSFTPDFADARGDGGSIPTTLGCKGSNTTYRVRSDAGQPAAQAASGAHADTVVLTIEP